MHDEPTADELAAAQAVLARKAAADQAKVAAVLPDLRALVEADQFAASIETAKALIERLPAGTAFHAHLTAVITGLTNLKNDLGAE